MARMVLGKFISLALMAFALFIDLNMKYIDTELIKSTKDLYNDIDSCIGELIKARFDHNQENEGKALFRMEGLMVTTLQQLDCIIDSLQQEQPSLPDNLDEAELKYVESLDNPPANQEEERIIYQTFKARAEWMTKQIK